MTSSSQFSIGLTLLLVSTAIAAGGLGMPDDETRAPFLIDMIPLVLQISPSLSYIEHAGGAVEVIPHPRAPSAALALLESKGIDIWVPYQSMVLANLTAFERVRIEAQGLRLYEMEDRTRIAIGSFLFDTRRGEPSISSNLRDEPSPDRENSLRIVQFIGPVKEEWMTRVRSMGVVPLDYVPNFALLAQVPASSVSKIAEMPFVQWIGAYHPAYKISTSFSSSYRNTTAPIPILLSIAPDEDAAIRSKLEAAGVAVSAVRRTGDRVLAEGHASYRTVEKATHLPFVIAVESKGIAHAANNQAVWVIQSGSSGSTPIFNAGIQGQGQIITMMDTGIDQNHEMFTQSGKIVAIEPISAGADTVDNEGHGTHVAGTLVGDAPPYDTYNSYDGMAFRARIYVQDATAPGSGDVLPPSSPLDAYIAAIAHGSYIHTNSWGLRDPSQMVQPYSAYARAIDDFVWSNNRNFLVLHAAGNRGPGPSTLYQEASAKNVVTVGATYNGASANDVWVDSSRGPTKDLRRKPTVVAPGAGVVSAKTILRGGCTAVGTAYQECSGTSMATPMVAGAAALIRQYFMEGWYPTRQANPADAFTPTAALLRAMLINGADKITGPGAFLNGPGYPNNDQGWGRINLQNVLLPVNGGTVTVVDEKTGLQQGQYKEYTVVVAAGQKFEATLVWTDPPAPVNCETSCTINNLDLLVTDPSNAQYTPSDSINPEEAVIISFPVDGTYRIRVTATRVSPGPQPFALVITYRLGALPGGSPFIAAWSGADYQVDNNVLPLSEVFSRDALDVPDHYRLQIPVEPRDGTYSLKLVEFEDEHSFFDSAALRAVDHDPGVRIGVHPQTGEIFTYEVGEPASSAIDNYGRSVLASITSWDGIFYRGWRGDYIELNFGKLRKDHARLVVVADPCCYKTRILVQVWNGIDWELAGTMHNRVRFAEDVVDLSRYAPSQQDVRVRLVGVTPFNVERVTLDTGPPHETLVQEAPLLAAVHSSGTNVASLLAAGDGTYAELVPGEEILMTFGLVPVGDEGRSFVFVSSGHYVHTYQPLQDTEIQIDGLRVSLQAVVPQAPLGQYWNVEISNLLWDFGDGTGDLAGWIVNHDYAQAGEYAVTVRIAYQDGHVKSYERIIIVSG